MNNPRFTIYRLKIEPFMSGAPISEDVAEKVAEYILAHLMDIKFVDGNGEPIITYGSEIFDTLGYVTIEKKKKMTIDMKECRKQEELPTYPDFALVLDARKPQKEGILIGIQNQSKCFANLDTVRKRLEKYWSQTIWDEFNCNVELRQITSSDMFWKTLDRKIQNGCKLTGLHLDVAQILKNDFINEQVKEKASMVTSFFSFLEAIDAGDCGFFFNAKPGKELDVTEVKHNLGMVITLSCKYGFVVKAQFDHEKDWITSEAAAPFVKRLDSSAFVKPEGTKAVVKAAKLKQMAELTRWFDEIVVELERIKKDKQNEQTRHTVKR